VFDPPYFGAIVAGIEVVIAETEFAAPTLEIVNPPPTEPFPFPRLYSA
jgi:hypothetical protein